MNVKKKLTKALDQISEEKLKVVMAEIILVIDYPNYTTEQKYDRIEKICKQKIYDK